MLDMSLSEHTLTLLREITTNSGIYSTGGSKLLNTFKTASGSNIYHYTMLR